MESRQNILICPLEWGMGHAARMIPFAVRLLDMGHNVMIGSGEDHLALFRKEIPGIRCISFPGFRPGFSSIFPQYIFLLLQIPRLVFHSIKEHFQLKRIVRENEINTVISDNRFGLWNRNIKSVYITHQIRIPFPGAFRIFEFTGLFLHRRIIKKYTYCFIPDLPGEINLSGRLSHGMQLPANTFYTGILSRFAGISSLSGTGESGCQYLVILSGPEPQRGKFKNKLTVILQKRAVPAVILEGEPRNDSTMKKSGSLIFYNHLPSPEMKGVIEGSRLIITRSGYTTIMELASLGLGAIVVPTPGQTEQEYLASYLHEKGWFTCILQKDLERDLPESAEHKKLPGEITRASRVLFESAVAKILDQQ